MDKFTLFNIGTTFAIFRKFGQIQISDEALTKRITDGAAF